MEGDAGRCAAANGRPADEKGAHVGRRASLSSRTEESFQKREGGVNGLTFDAGGLHARDRNAPRRLPPRGAGGGGWFAYQIPGTGAATALSDPCQAGPPLP